MAKKKTLLIIPVIFIITIIISLLTPMCVYADDDMYEPRLTAPSQSISYYNRELNTYAQTGTPMPNCVAYAYGRIYEMNGEKPLITRGNAGEWWGINIRNGFYPYGQSPKVGAVACWSGHVAIVEKVNSNGSVTLSESHWGGRYFDVVTYSSMSAHYGQRFYGYIYTYNEGLTQDLKTKLLNTESNKVESVDFAKNTDSVNAGLAILDLNTDNQDNSKKVLFLSDKLEVK